MYVMLLPWFQVTRASGLVNQTGSDKIFNITKLYRDMQEFQTLITVALYNVSVDEQLERGFNFSSILTLFQSSVQQDMTSQ